ncbi:MAG: purine-nucleoside phosphorylase [Ignavibacteria bacterium]|nr:purine-nucleoside phosphorylase [Ignavibacteria bacterium]
MTHPDLSLATAWLREQGHDGVDAALILGSGLRSFDEEIAAGIRYGADALPGTPIATTPGQDGSIAFCTIENRPRGRLPRQGPRLRGHDAATTAFPALLAHALGASLLLTTNAAGGVHPDLEPGDLMLVTDFIVLPLAARMGAALQELPAGDRNTDGGVVYLSSGEQRRLIGCATAAGIPLRAGTYGYCSGPSYETRAEIAMLRRIGVDAVGMSTVPEILAAWQRGMRVVPISCITNKAQTVATVTTHGDVTRVAAEAEAVSPRCCGKFSARTEPRFRRMTIAVLLTLSLLGYAHCAFAGGAIRRGWTFGGRPRSAPGTTTCGAASTSTNRRSGISSPCRAPGSAAVSRRSTASAGTASASAFRRPCARTRCSS